MYKPGFVKAYIGGEAVTLALEPLGNACSKNGLSTQLIPIPTSMDCSQ